MSALSLTLRHFARSSPVCTLGTTAVRAIELLHQSASDLAVAIGPQRTPVGLVRLQDLLPYLCYEPAFTAGPTPPPPAIDDLLKPLLVVPAAWTVARLAHRVQIEPQTSDRACALVNAEGQFVGLLDRDSLLQTLLSGDRPFLPPEPPSELAALCQLLDQLPIPISLQTPEGEIVRQNPAWREQLASEATASSDDACAQTWCNLGDVPPQELPAAASPSPPASVLPEQVWQFIQLPLALRTEPQAERPASLVLVLATDVTEQRQLCKELSAKNADLIQLNRLKDEFLACISHELKTPLTAVMGLSSLLKDRKLGDLNHRQQRYAQLIYQSGRQLMNVVNDILDLTRLETGQLRLNFEPVKLRAVCERAYQQARLKLAGRETTSSEENLPEIHFTLDIEAGLETIVADELRLRQMLIHLLENALKFTPPEGEVGLRVSRWQGWIDFTVWDTGIGIPESAQHLIFQKFQQLESPLTRQHEGTGLGLVLTQRLARAHGGDVSFISKVGKGSQFTLLLPPVPPERDRRGSARPAAESSNQLVLIVEAVPHYIERLTQQLHRLGYRVAIARSGTEALEKARQVQPRAILLNPLLPLLSGWDVLTLLKADSRTQDIPTIVTATRAERQQALSSGADGFLSVPVKASELQVALGGLRDRRPQRRDLTLLLLSPNTHAPDRHSSIFVAELGRALNAKAAGLNCRILEAGDLEQASILARVWQPDVLLLDGGRLSNPAAYLEALVQHNSVARLPLVTLDAATTAAANQFSQLTVYPCLIPIDERGIEALLQAIQVAAGLTTQPNILLLGSEPLPLAPESPESPAALEAATLRSDELLHALVQYLQTAGLRSLLASSWLEVYQQIQQHNVDVLAIDLGKRQPDREWLAGLERLQTLEAKPPVLILVHPETPADLEGQLAETLAAIAARVVRCPPQSMAELLTEINQLLTCRSEA